MPVFTDDIARLVPHMRRFSRALVVGHSVQFADDLVQETVVLAMRAERIAGGTNLTGWCFSTLMRVHRLRARTSDQVEGGRIERPSRSTGPHPAIAFLPKPIARLDLLSIDCREALLLTVLVGMTYAEAAATLHVTVDTVLHRLDLARAVLARAERPSEPARLAAASGRAARPAHHLRLVK